MTKYPVNWQDIAAIVKNAASWKCEHCGHPHDPTSGHTLTVHHLDGNPLNCSNYNLVALCQRCHLHIQAIYKPGQFLLPNIDYPDWLKKRIVLFSEHLNKEQLHDKRTSQST